MQNVDQIRGMLFKVEFSNLASRNLSRNKTLKKFTNINLRFFCYGCKIRFPTYRV